MSMKPWRKIDSFYPISLVVVLVLAALVVFTFRGIFSSIISAYGIDVDVRDAKPRIDRGKLDEAIRVVYEKEKVELRVK